MFKSLREEELALTIFITSPLCYACHCVVGFMNINYIDVEIKPYDCRSVTHGNINGLDQVGDDQQQQTALVFHSTSVETASVSKLLC